MNIRLCYSRLHFLKTMLKDLEALTQKEMEYLEYLRGCTESIDFIIV